ncbi:MAG: anthranilate synthase component I family protein [Raineya sp.]
MEFRWSTDTFDEAQLLAWASSFKYCCFLNPNHWQKEYPQGSFPKILAIAQQKSSISFLDEQNFSGKWLFGYLGYDLKNRLEQLHSQHTATVEFEDSLCFEPLHLFIWENNTLRVRSTFSENQLLTHINSFKSIKTQKKIGKIEAKVGFEEYCQNVEAIKNHIVEGDIYELNYCIEFFAEHTSISPLDTYLHLCQFSPMPFSAFLKVENKYILCASPERFLKKEGRRLISQPIKGTIRRGANPKEDKLNEQKLRNSEKEIAENMMIVDLVRNDLARSATIGSTKVVEFFGIYPFRQVFQMISTIEAELHPECSPQKALANAFPMGSMTGAPKIKAMELIERYENSKRGVFSGAIGYFSPEGDFDFNVVIRSIFYDAQEQKLSFQVGSAITYDAQAEEEYQECMLKAQAIRQVLE